MKFTQLQQKVAQIKQIEISECKKIYNIQSFLCTTHISLNLPVSTQSTFCCWFLFIWFVCFVNIKRTRYAKNVWVRCLNLFSKHTLTYTQKSSSFRWIGFSKKEKGNRRSLSLFPFNSIHFRWSYHQHWTFSSTTHPHIRWTQMLSEFALPFQYPRWAVLPVPSAYVFFPQRRCHP